MPVKMLDGNAAVVEALIQAAPGVVAAYPITPQSPISENLALAVSNKALDAQYIRVESEHSAMSSVIGAQLTGVRSVTATASVGLALMHEVLGVASGLRLPIIMPVVNRALVAPWSLWCDHQDSMSERDSGWLQFYAENVQQIYDLILTAFKIAEDHRVLTPAMICLDGFFLSHSVQRLTVNDPDEVASFLGEYQPGNMLLDPENPLFVNDLTSPDEFTEMRYQQKMGFDNSLEIIPTVYKEYQRKFGRQLNLVDDYYAKEADIVLVTIGSMTGTAKYVINDLRKKGINVGVLGITCFRPFPGDVIKNTLKNARVIGVIDRSAGLGSPCGPLCNEVRALGISDRPVYGFVCGLGGRDINESTIRRALDHLQHQQNDSKWSDQAIWIDLKDSPESIRERQG